MVEDYLSGIQEWVLLFSKEMNPSTLFVLLINMYMIMITKEFIIEKLWLNYKVSFLVSLKTTIYLLLIPVSSLSLVFHFLIVEMRNQSIRQKKLIESGEFIK